MRGRIHAFTCGRSVLQRLCGPAIALVALLSGLVLVLGPFVIVMGALVWIAYVIWGGA